MSSRRRPRDEISGDEDESDRQNVRGSIPVSTAPANGKRQRRGLIQSQDHNGETSDDGAVASIAEKNPRHQPGAIVRVKLTNFVTYTSAEFFPGPNLNMVIGPNGTGKSTLVCAICLGLGWGPSLLGRAKDPAEFVKHGCREATIEIELQRATSGPNRSSSNPVITRVIKKENNKSAFTLNGSNASNKAVLELARSYNIQIDNLCQFLPQDRVVEFAQMNPIQMLESTLQAAAEPEIVKWLEDLKTLRAHQQGLMSNNKGDRDMLANLESRQEMQRTEVERLKERAIVQKKIEWLELCRPIPRYTEAKNRTRQAKEQAHKLAAEVKELKDESRPSLRRVNAKQEYHRRVVDHVKERRSHVKNAEDECRRLEREISGFESEVKDCDTTGDAERRSIAPTNQDIARLKAVIARQKHEKKNEPEPFDSRAMNEDIQERTNRIRELSQKIDGVKEGLRQRKEAGTEHMNKNKALKAQRDNLETVSGQQELRLERLSKDTYRAWKWIEENRDKFQKEVFAPPLIACSLKDPQMADAVETMLQQSDARIITAQCREDFKLLQQELIKNQRLHNISLRVCPFDNMDRFQSPMSSEQMARYGLSGWAIDYLQGPSTVLAMLCQERNLHQCAIAEHDVSEDQHQALLKTSVRSYIAGRKAYAFGRRAEYGSAGDFATTRDLKRATIWTNAPVDIGRKTAIEQDARYHKSKLAEISDEMKELKQQLDELAGEKGAEEKEKEDMVSTKDEKQRVLTEWKGLDTKIAQNQERIESLRQNLDEVNQRLLELQKKKDRAMFAKSSAVLQFATAVHALRDCKEQLLIAQTLQLEAQSDVEVLTSRNQHVLDTLREKEAAEKTAIEESKQQMKHAQRVLEDVKRLKSYADEVEREQNESGLMQMLTAFSQNRNMTAQDLEDLLDVERARLELTTGGDANTIKEFEQRARKIEKLKRQLADFLRQQDDFIHGIKEIRGRFEEALSPLVSAIDAAFADSFARIGCAGQVAVHKASSTDPGDCTEEMGGPENGLDFANWAIHIRVKFRDNEPLSLLDSHRQSGGERAVSTIFYLMALQSLSRAPFRVVDEINQGMDPRNERMVHGRMVDIAAEDHVRDGGGGSQYFLITPKLLSGLKYRRGMTVLCIVSGENMPSASDVRRRGEDGKIVTITKGHKVDFRHFVRMAQDLNLGGRGGTSKGGMHEGMTSEGKTTNSLPVRRGLQVTT